MSISYVFDSKQEYMEFLSEKVKMYDKLLEILDKYNIFTVKLSRSKLADVTIEDTQTVLIEYTNSVYRSFLSIFQTTVKDRKLTNVSSEYSGNLGFMVTVTTDDIEYSTYVNSYFIGTKFGSMKVLEYDSSGTPINVNFVGTKFTNLTRENFHQLLEKSHSNVSKLVSLLTSTKLKYVQILNNINISFKQ